MPMSPYYELELSDLTTKSNNNLDIKHCKCNVTESKNPEIHSYLENKQLKELMITIDGQTIFVWTADFNANDLVKNLNNKILSGVKK